MGKKVKMEVYIKGTVEYTLEDGETTDELAEYIETGDVIGLAYNMHECANDYGFFIKVDKTTVKELEE